MATSVADGTLDGEADPTLSDSLGYLLAGWDSISPNELWPPDVYALCAYLLTTSGLYSRIVDRLRPQKTWPANARRVGQDWVRAISRRDPAPTQVLNAWNYIKGNAALKISLVSSNNRLAVRLFALVGYCDEACAGIGVPTTRPSRRILRRGIRYLRRHGTLTPRIPVSQCRILPKLHVPNVGLTTRSLTHHLAYHPNSEVYVNWLWSARTHSDRFNMLLAPWPKSIKPTDFKAKPKGVEFANEVNEFDYDPSDSEDFIDWVTKLLKAARTTSGPIDALVLPELAISEDQFNELVTALKDQEVVIIAGVRTKKEGRTLNTVRIDLAQPMAAAVEQPKHHRWKLDTEQISNYGLGGLLDPHQDWWESTIPELRRINFISLSLDLTFCCLVCEDLARQEPVASLVRCVSPNLVVALLMDGPQVEERWSARYATVLADDPGSSVLCLTSLGMANLSNRFASSPKRRTIALWKDNDRKAFELSLPDGAEGLVLHTWPEATEEKTIDGRSDDGGSAFVRLRGWYPVYIDRTSPNVRKRARS